MWNGSGMNTFENYRFYCTSAQSYCFWQLHQNQIAFPPQFAPTQDGTTSGRPRYKQRCTQIRAGRGGGRRWKPNRDLHPLPAATHHQEEKEIQEEVFFSPLILLDLTSKRTCPCRKWTAEAFSDKTATLQSRRLSFSLSLFSFRWLAINLSSCKYESGMFDFFFFFFLNASRLSA